MGQEIEHDHFRKQDFTGFESRLRQETELLTQWFGEHRLSTRRPTVGYELEAWLVDEQVRPVPGNERFLELVHSDLVSPELARFNIELNSAPRKLGGTMLRAMQEELVGNWWRCNEAARQMDAELLLVGILPTVQYHQLTLDNMSAMTRYRALNEQVLRMRRGEPLELNITGREHYLNWHTDVMLESVATSLQMHIQAEPSLEARIYNAAIVLSAPMVAATANSPYLFGYDLWDETRIPVFEQAVSVTGRSRVFFGSSYVQDSLLECFIENYQDYPVLLPVNLDDDPATLSHLRLHNGTIWRWNRPLVGFNDEGTPHLRIEHRVVAAGPSLVDTVANMALFYGLVWSLARSEDIPEASLSFAHARENFYNAAKDGLNSRLRWLKGNEVGAQLLLTEELLPLAKKGLQDMGCNQDDIRQSMEILEARLRKAQNGAAWQRAFIAKHGRDMQALTLAYRDHQRGGRPVGEWTL
ncbi:MAG: glutamate-cysteine ligase family protein [Gammaproteobacteria bacterium]|nr:MAG: glutamate-cysteine ligase family protein [Gammaproteobacteria bacterium]